VRIVDLPPETLAVQRFTGSWSEDALAARKQDLLRVLDQSDWRAIADPVAMFYDPPWTIPFLRRNEVAVVVEPR
jgi:hypothetical protein